MKIIYIKYTYTQFEKKDYQFYQTTLTIGAA